MEGGDSKICKEGEAEIITRILLNSFLDPFPSFENYPDYYTWKFRRPWFYNEKKWKLFVVFGDIINFLILTLGGIFFFENYADY